MGAVYLPEDLANLSDTELAERLEKAWDFYDTANQEIESWSRLRRVLDKFIYMMLIVTILIVGVILDYVPQWLSKMTMTRRSQMSRAILEIEEIVAEIKRRVKNKSRLT